MLNFLRKIRRSFTESGSARKYILYAIGEIALVVIGILIALQINNWNENQRVQAQVSLYLMNLSEALNEDIGKHNGAAGYNEFRYNFFQYLLKITNNEQLAERPLPKNDQVEWEMWPGEYPDTLNKELIELGFGNSVFLQAQNTNNNVYEEMKSMGLMSQIRNHKLKKDIHDYYNFCNTFLHENGDWNQRLSTSWQSFLRDNHDFIISGSQIFGDPIKILDDPKVIVRIQELTAPAFFRVSNSRRAVSKAENLMNQIAKELGMH